MRYFLTVKQDCLRQGKHIIMHIFFLAVGDYESRIVNKRLTAQMCLLWLFLFLNGWFFQLTSDLSDLFAERACVLHWTPAGWCVFFAQQSRPAGQVCPCGPDHLLPPYAWTCGAGRHCRSLGEWVLRSGEPVIHSRGATWYWPAPHPVSYLFQPVAGLPPYWDTGQRGSTGQLGSGAPGCHHLQLHAGLPEREAFPWAPGGADYLHRKCDSCRDLLHFRWKVQLHTSGDPVLCHGWVEALDLVAC